MVWYGMVVVSMSLPSVSYAQTSCLGYPGLAHRCHVSPPPRPPNLALQSLTLDHRQHSVVFRFVFRSAERCSTGSRMKSFSLPVSLLVVRSGLSHVGFIRRKVSHELAKTPFNFM